MSKNVADALITTLEKIGVKQIFGLIGDSLNPIGDAVRKSSIEWVGVRHEEGAALAAAGQAKLTGKLGVCAGTTGPGSTHLVAGLYEAARDHAPVLALSGEMSGKFQGIDYIQTTQPNLLFRDVALYTAAIISPDQAPGVIHQAIAAAYAGSGVSHLVLPQDVLSASVNTDVPSLETLKPREPFAASDTDIQSMVKLIEQSNNIVILCGAGCHGEAEQLRELSDRLKAPLIHSVKGKDILPFDDHRWMGGIGMIGTKASYHAMMHCDLLIMLGTDYPYSEFLPQKTLVIQIDERAQVLGRRTAMTSGFVGSIGPTLKLLLAHLTPKTKSDFFDDIADRRKKWDAVINKQADLSRSNDKIHPQAVARTVSELAKPDAVFVLDTGLNTLWSGNWIQQTGTQRIIGSFNNAAVGTALGQANGIQALNRSRQVIALCGDGGFNMLLSEFLTTVHHKLPVKVIIYNNSSFGLINLEAESIGIIPFKEAIEFPNPDFAALARACGAHGFTVKKPGELKAAISDAFNVEGPAIVDVTVVANELPNVPYLTFDMVEKVTLSKIKQAINSVMGS
ncbi:MAG: thiamine pyrophosphate-dependent enzyme [Gammaproteobacteria bacterium]